MSPKDFQVDPTLSIFPETLGTAPSANRLANRKILVVGGGQRKTIDEQPPIGNGRAISVLFAREGAQITVLDHNLEAAQATVSQIESEVGKGRATPYVFDVRNGDGIAKAVDDAKAAMGGLDGLVIVVGTSRRIPLEQLTRQNWEDDFAINTTSHFLFSQRAVEVMNPGGSIVLISSMSAIRALDNNPVYEASKAALLGLNMSLARAGEGRGIRCNAICMVSSPFPCKLVFISSILFSPLQIPFLLHNLPPPYKPLLPASPPLLPKLPPY
jgi:NAD(P)-dependent dehydrogenase (short-subunit alcohol dehydrogenase family)